MWCGCGGIAASKQGGIAVSKQASRQAIPKILRAVYTRELFMRCVVSVSLCVSVFVCLTVCVSL